MIPSAISQVLRKCDNEMVDFQTHEHCYGFWFPLGMREDFIGFGGGGRTTEKKTRHRQLSLLTTRSCAVKKTTVSKSKNRQVFFFK